MNKRGQTMMDYLATYGWAILIIIVVIGALYAMGVFQGQTPEQVKNRVNFCKDLCINANMTYNDYGTSPNGNVYCDCQPEKNCLSINNSEYCKDTGNVGIVKYVKVG